MHRHMLRNSVVLPASGSRTYSTEFKTDKITVEREANGGLYISGSDLVFYRCFCSKIMRIYACVNAYTCTYLFTQLVISLFRVLRTFRQRTRAHHSPKHAHAQWYAARDRRNTLFRRPERQRVERRCACTVWQYISGRHSAVRRLLGHATSAEVIDVNRNVHCVLLHESR